MLFTIRAACRPSRLGLLLLLALLAGQAQAFDFSPGRWMNPSRWFGGDDYDDDYYPGPPPPPPYGGYGYPAPPAAQYGVPYGYPQQTAPAQPGQPAHPYGGTAPGYGQQGRPAPAYSSPM